MSVFLKENLLIVASNKVIVIRMPKVALAKIVARYSLGFNPRDCKNIITTLTLKYKAIRVN